VLAGGIPEVGRAEDSLFGDNLERLAEKYGAYILSRRKEWIMRTAFRESRRTGSSFGPVFDNIRKHKGKPMVRNADAPHYFYDYLPKFLLAVRKTVGKKAALSELFGDLFNEADNDVQRAVMNLAKRIPTGVSASARLRIYDAWKEKNSKTRPDRIFYAKYKQEFPLVTLTPELLKALKKEVYKDSARKVFAEEAVEAFAKWKLPSESK